MTERNIDSVAEVVRWFLNDPRRSQIWRILSFQPEANTGRTIFSRHPVTPATVWEKLCQGMGLELDGNACIGGHPACNQGTTLLVDQRSGDYRPVLPNDQRSRALFAEMLEALGGISTMTTDSLLPYRMTGALARHPRLAIRSIARPRTTGCRG